MKKGKGQRPEQLLAPQRITTEAFAVAMQRLLRNEDFQLLEAHLINVRGEILESGKTKPSKAQWSVLKGFDFAVMEPRRWAKYRRRSGEMGERAQELESILNGGGA